MGKRGQCHSAPEFCISTKTEPIKLTEAIRIHTSLEFTGIGFKKQNSVIGSSADTWKSFSSASKLEMEFFWNRITYVRIEMEMMHYL